MRNRPVRALVDALRTLGAEIDYMEKEGFPPLKVTGRRLPGGEVTLDAGVSSQYISALLMIWSRTILPTGDSSVSLPFLSPSYTSFGR